jgi:hypothetical protein
MSPRSTRVKYLARLARMSWDEMCVRGRQELLKRVDFARYRLGKSFERSSRLSSSASCNGARFFFSDGEVPTIANVLQSRLPDEVDRIVSTAHKICRHEFDLLGYTDVAYGQNVDWHSDAVHQKRTSLRPWYRLGHLNFDDVGDAKLIWELNRHQHLVVLAKAHLLTGDTSFASELFCEWYQWREANPYPIGINWASSLEVALRSLAWLWVRHLSARFSELPGNFSCDLAHALALNGRHIEKYLSTYSSPNTHLLGEGVGLFFIGMLCPEISAAQRWREKGWRIVCQEARRQVRGDGVHFEQSTYYHVYALDFFLHARILAARNGIPIPREFDQVLQRMLDFLCDISQAGVTPRLGDDDGGRVFDPRRNHAVHLLDPVATGAVLFHRADWKTAARRLREEAVWLLGLPGIAVFDDLADSDPIPRSTGFVESGIYVMAGRSYSPQQLVIDAGPQGIGASGHGHADALSVHLSIGGQEWLTDPGTFSYLNGEDTREAFRSTPAHNTLQVDGVSQAVPTSPFSWQHLPRVGTDLWKVGGTFACFQGHHTGYGRLPEPVTHRRSVYYVKSRFWLIRDLAEGEGEHRLDLFWHFAPGIRLSRQVGNAFMFGINHGPVLSVLAPEGHSWSQEVNPGWHSPVYGQKEPAAVLNFSRTTELPAGFATLLLPLPDGETEPGRLVDVTPSTGRRDLYSCAYQEKRRTHQWVFSDTNTRWQLGELASDARVLYCLFDSTGRLIEFVVCDGSFFKVTEQSLFTARECTSIYEWRDESVATKPLRDGNGRARVVDPGPRLILGSE